MTVHSFPVEAAQSLGPRMLRTALDPASAGWPEDAAVEVMLNPDGRRMADRLSSSLLDVGGRLSAEDRGRIPRVIARTVGIDMHANRPRPRPGYQRREELRAAAAHRALVELACIEGLLAGAEYIATPKGDPS